MKNNFQFSIQYIDRKFVLKSLKSDDFSYALNKSTFLLEHNQSLEPFGLTPNSDC